MTTSMLLKPRYLSESSNFLIYYSRVFNSGFEKLSSHHISQFPKTSNDTYTFLSYNVVKNSIILKKQDSEILKKYVSLKGVVIDELVYEANHEARGKKFNLKIKIAGVFESIPEEVIGYHSLMIGSPIGTKLNFKLINQSEGYTFEYYKPVFEKDFSPCVMGGTSESEHAGLFLGDYRS